MVRLSSQPGWRDVTLAPTQRFGSLPAPWSLSVPFTRLLKSILLMGAGIACRADLLSPSSHAIAGRWLRSPEPLSPAGIYVRTLEFTVDGHYVVTGASRGVYAALPVDSVGSITQEYGRYVLESNILRFTQDSIRSWDHLGGSYFHAGPQGLSIEGPPTDPSVELTSTRLTLRYSVNPGAGYVEVTDTYDRDIRTAILADR